MKQWQETSQILRSVAQLVEDGEGAAIATVVHIQGSAYRRPGAKLLVDASGGTQGGVSGGCLEADVREVGLEVIRDGVPRMRHYETGADEETVWGLGLGCDGAVDIFVQSATTREAKGVFGAVARLLDGDAPFALSTVVADSTDVGRAVVVAGGERVAGSTGDGEMDRALHRCASSLLVERRSNLHELGSAQVFTEVHIPPDRLVIIGAGDDAMPLASLAAQVGFRVAVVDHRPAFLSPGRFPDTSHLVHARPERGVGDLSLNSHCYIVVMTHSLAHDREWIRLLLGTEAPYIGVLGPRSRTDKILETLPHDVTSRVFSPVGLDVGADGPEQVALSVVAELLAVRADREPRHLRQRDGAIHAV